MPGGGQFSSPDVTRGYGDAALQDGVLRDVLRDVPESQLRDLGYGFDAVVGRLEFAPSCEVSGHESNPESSVIFHIAHPCGCGSQFACQACVNAIVARGDLTCATCGAEYTGTDLDFVRL